MDGWSEPATVDIRFISDDPLHVNEPYWPPVGSRVAGVYQGQMPSGQYRVSLRASDL